MPHKMKASGERRNEILADTFRAARAAVEGSWPSCPRCHDGQDVRAGYDAIRENPALRAYWCRACRSSFSDLTGTALEKTRKPLRLWAYLVLGGDIAALPGAYKEQRRRYRAMRARAAALPTTQRWRAELEKAGITVRMLVWEDRGVRPGPSHRTAPPKKAVGA